MDKSAEQPINLPQSFPLNHPKNTLIYGNPIINQSPNPTNNSSFPAQNPPNKSPNQPYVPQNTQPLVNQVQPIIVNIVNTQFGTNLFL